VRVQREPSWQRTDENGSLGGEQKRHVRERRAEKWLCLWRERYGEKKWRPRENMDAIGLYLATRSGRTVGEENRAREMEREVYTAEMPDGDLYSGKG